MNATCPAPFWFGSICREVANASAAQLYCFWSAYQTPRSVYADALGLPSSCVFIESGGAHGAWPCNAPMPASRSAASSPIGNIEPRNLMTCRLLFVRIGYIRCVGHMHVDVFNPIAC